MPTTIVLFTNCISPRCTLTMFYRAVIDQSLVQNIIGSPCIPYHVNGPSCSRSLHHYSVCFRNLLVCLCCQMPPTACLLFPCFSARSSFSLNTVPLLPLPYFIELPFSLFLLFLFPLYCTTSLSYIPFPIYANNTTRLALLLPLPHVSTAQPKSVLTSIIASSTALFSFAIQSRHDRRRTCQRFI